MNAPFLANFPNSTVPANTPFLGRCGVQAAPAASTAPAATTPATTAATNTAGTRPTVTVQSGDTLSGIGARTGVDWQTIASLNNIAGPAYMVQPGQVLFLR